MSTNVGGFRDALLYADRPRRFFGALFNELRSMGAVTLVSDETRGLSDVDLPFQGLTATLDNVILAGLANEKSAPALVENRGQAAPAPFQMKTILVVDDEYALVENLTELLRDEGYRVVSAGNGKDGLERAVAEKPDLILTDLMMPISDGRELVRGVRALPAFRGIPIIMMSATNKEVALADSHGPLDVSCFMAKPFRWHSLHDAVVTLIGGARREGGAGA